MAFNQSDALPTKGAMSQLDTAMLETLVPGYTFISRFFLSYLHIDLTAYLQYLVALAVLGAALRYILQYLSEFFKQYLVSTAEIRLDDEIFNYLMYWMSRQPHMKRTNRFLAGVKTNGYWSDNDDSDAEDSDDDAGDEDWHDPAGHAERATFDEYWAKAVNRDKYKTLRFTPSQGRHFFWFQGRPLMLERQHQNQTARWVLNNERLYLSCLGRDPAILKTVMAEAQRAYVERDGNRTIIYRGQRLSSGNQFMWARCMSRSPRSLDTVILDDKQKQDFLSDIQDYLLPRTSRWYASHGIPYRRGYLLYGPPVLLYLLNLNSRALDEDNLYSLFSELPRRCIVLLEDVDTAGITQSRGRSVVGKTPIPKDNQPEAGILPEAPEDPPKPVDTTSSDKSERDGITLSGLLNVLDGVAASEGRILVMTTNHPEKLDAALRRAGRVDMDIAFRYAIDEDIEKLFKSIYSIHKNEASPRSSKRWSKSINGDAGIKQEARTDKAPTKQYTEEEQQRQTEFRKQRLDMEARIVALAREFASVVPSGELSPADIQGYLLTHKNAPEAAVKGAPAWVQDVMEKKQRAKEELEKRIASESSI
ncbi:hypothetical protein N7462_000747 [Penicillium macrosclerotiorum]|uniref:uncharacterized protein n=1 Tax=Penicillium macrosclerotiorum TaxID=303699 RepID=UPI0025482BAF|nr:uncharacterized protein N7462_000747 [Penicillium macrosclerotiorum]KAJ5698742.1 hypothetical protein N7462_000747 [Penicillium macrosclerotiorum]